VKLREEKKRRRRKRRRRDGEEKWCRVMEGQVLIGAEAK
jgi:hypothetical protein